MKPTLRSHDNSNLNNSQRNSDTEKFCQKRSILWMKRKSLIESDNSLIFISLSIMYPIARRSLDSSRGNLKNVLEGSDPNQAIRLRGSCRLRNLFDELENRTRVGWMTGILDNVGNRADCTERPGRSHRWTS